MGYQLPLGSPMAFLTECHMPFPRRALLTFISSLGWCSISLASLISVIPTQLHSAASHIIFSWAAQGRGRRDYSQGRTHLVLFMLLFYKPQGPSENFRYSHFISCFLVTLCSWGKIIYSFFSIYFPIKNIHFYLYPHSKFNFFSSGTSWLRMEQEGKELPHKIRMCSNVSYGHTAVYCLSTNWAQRLSRSVKDVSLNT